MSNNNLLRRVIYLKRAPLNGDYNNNRGKTIEKMDSAYDPRKKNENFRVQIRKQQIDNVFARQR